MSALVKFPIEEQNGDSNGQFALNLSYEFAGSYAYSKQTFRGSTGHGKVSFHKAPMFF